MKLARFYRQAVFYPSLFLVLFLVIFAILDNYKSEGAVAKFTIAVSIITTLIYCLLMCGFSLTIFLNKFKKLNRSFIWNVLSWFLLPVGYLALVLKYDIQNRIKYEFGFGEGFVYLVIMILPFVISLGWTFLTYIRMKRSHHEN